VQRDAPGVVRSQDAEDTARAASRPRRSAPLTAAAWVFLVVGTAGALTGSLLWRTNRLDRRQTAMATATADVEQAVSSSLLQAGDLTTAVRGEVMVDPTSGSAALSSWLNDVSVTSRYPETVAVGTLSLADPGGCGVDRVGVAGATSVVLPAPLTASALCRALSVPPLVAVGSAPSGALAVVDLGTASHPVMVEALPLYRLRSAGGSPGSPPRLAGWVWAAFDADQMLEDALGSAVTPQGVSVRAELWRASTLGPTTDQLLASASVPMASRATAADPHAQAPRGWRAGLIAVDGGWDVDVDVTVEPSLAAIDVETLAVAVAGVVFTLWALLLVAFVARQHRSALQEVERRTRQLRHLRRHDPLTGLANLEVFLEHLEERLADPLTRADSTALLVIQLERFQSVQDTLGRTVADELVSLTATRLLGALRGSDLVGRIGPDLFAVLLAGGPGSSPSTVAERLLELLRRPAMLSTGPTQTQFLTVRAGLASGRRGHGADLVGDAQLALRQAVRLRLEGCCVYDPSMRQAARGRLDLELDLRAALASDQLYLAYQPTFSLAPVRITGVEALVRWRHPERGELGPCEFVPLAEECGLVVDLGRFVLRAACAQAAAWQQAGTPVAVSVNVSARQLGGTAFVGEVAATLAATRLDPALLVLEITETAIMADTSVAVEALAALKRLGVRIAIDDFGTGYSSLAYLRQFPVDTLKIDRSFVKGIAQSAGADALLHTLVQLGKQLHLETLAEGIEDVIQLERLQAEGCDSGQGFLLARPVPAARVAELLTLQHAEGDPGLASEPICLLP
jgi:diguanylate cyclase (GGDEF)-like protein